MGLGLSPNLKEASPVCDPVEEPTRVPLHNITFFPVPAGTTAEGGVQIVAGLTSNGISDLLGNQQTLKKREEAWRVRAQANKDCLKAEAEYRAKHSPPKK